MQYLTLLDVIKQTWVEKPKSFHIVILRWNKELWLNQTQNLIKVHQIHPNLWNKFTVSVVQVDQIFSWEGETLTDDNHMGRLSSSRTPEIIEKVRHFVKNNRYVSLRMMEESLNINKKMIRTIIDWNFGKTKYMLNFLHTLLSMNKKSKRCSHGIDIISDLKMMQTSWNQLLYNEIKRQRAEWKSSNSPQANKQEELHQKSNNAPCIFRL